MFATLLRRLVQLSRELYVRVILIAVLSVLSLLVSALVGPFIPPGFKELIGADAVDQILSIIANSMLAVAIFSLTMMTAAFRTASSQWTPRAHQALRRDTVTQNVLATFVGAYLYALLAIILRATNQFGERGIVVLFGFTLVVVALIIAAIVRWIVHLETLGSLEGTASRIEDATVEAIKSVIERPNGGARALTDPNTQIPGDAIAFHAVTTGYIEQVYQDALQDRLEECGARAWLVRRTGHFVHEGDVIAFVSANPPDLIRALKRYIPIRRQRRFDQDPRLGLRTLGEIAGRALSPGINDPQTAVEIIGRQQRLLHRIRRMEPAGSEVKLANLWMVPIRPEQLIRDAFEQISRDARDALEVHLALQRALAAIAMYQSPAIGSAARAFASEALARARQDLTFQPDLDRLDHAARRADGLAPLAVPPGDQETRNA